MTNFQRKNRKRSIWHTPPVLLIMGILVFIFAWGVVSFIGSLEDTVNNKKIAKEKVRELEERKNELMANIQNLETDKGKERIFRENFGLAKEGEGVIIVIDEENKDEPEKENKGFFGFFKKIFR